MRFSAALALAASPLLALAQNANPFKIPSSGLTATAGSTVTLNWEPTTSGTVSLLLRSGASGSLNAGTPIAQSIPNSGSYTWSLPSSLVRGSDYTVEIVSDNDKSKVNYTPQFVIDSTNTVATTSSGSSSSAATGTSSGTPTSSGTASRTGTSSAESTTPNGSATTSTGTSKTGSSTGTSTGTASRNTASSTGAGFQSSSTSTSARATGGAPRATAAAGMMGIIALGALAL